MSFLQNDRFTVDFHDLDIFTDFKNNILLRKESILILGHSNEHLVDSYIEFRRRTSAGPKTFCFRYVNHITTIAQFHFYKEKPKSLPFENNRLFYYTDHKTFDSLLQELLQRLINGGKLTVSKYINLEHKVNIVVPTDMKDIYDYLFFKDAVFTKEEILFKYMSHKKIIIEFISSHPPSSNCQFGTKFYRRITFKLTIREDVDVPYLEYIPGTMERYLVLPFEFKLACIQNRITAMVAFIVDDDEVLFPDGHHTERVPEYMMYDKVYLGAYQELLKVSDKVYKERNELKEKIEKLEAVLKNINIPSE
jgi:hypothetical protein